MFNHKIMVAVIFGLVFAVQIFVPSSRMMPRTYIGNERSGFIQVDVYTEQLASKSKTISISFDDELETYSADEVGISTDIEATKKQIPTISLKDKLIPLMPHYKLLKKHVVEPVIKRDSEVIQSFAAKVSQQKSVPSVNASAQIRDGKFDIGDDKPGRIYTTEAISTLLNSANPFNAEELTLSAEKTTAEITKSDLEPIAEEYDKRTSQKLTVAYGSTSKTIEPEELKKWFEVAKADDGKFTLRLNDTVVGGAIQAWSKEYNIAPGITQVSYYDDVEVSRKSGAAGRALNEAEVKKQLQAWFDEPKDEAVPLASTTLAPTVVATRTYSRSSAQLQSQIDAWIASHSGKYQVAIRELNGRGREASRNVSQQTVMASTYKTFLAYVAYKQNESGALNMGTQISGGKNVEQCIEVMIVNSDNDCAVKLGWHIGWAKADQIIAAAGFEGVLLNNYDQNGKLKGDKLVNAREQAKFLAQLAGGSLINQQHTNSLISYMKRQIYRDGIPAGSRGSVVADKVGFLDSYIHDVGIVYGPKSTYALVIMSEGSSWANIKNLSQAIYDFMNE